jgi:O-antigen/teichoic acid export membrane protein
LIDEHDGSASITHKLLKGSIWNSLSQFGSQIISLIITIIVARRLLPADFGLFGMVSIIAAFLGYFIEFGLTASLIQRKEVDRLDTDSVFWTSLAISVFLFVVMFIGAPLVSAFYKRPDLTVITRVVFLSLLIIPFNMMPEFVETKKLAYDKITIAELSSSIISSVVTVVLAYMGFGVWSLVWQYISKLLTRAAILLALTRWKPRFEYSWARIRSLLGMGFDITMNNLLTYAADNTDYLLVGKMLGETPLGLYTMSFKLSKYPILKIEGVFTKMLFPAFSTFNDDPARIRKNFFRLLLFFLTWATPVFIFGYFACGPLVNILLGEKWSATIPLVQIFLIYLVFSSFCVQNNPILIALNKVRIWNIVQLLSTAMLALSGFIGIKLLGIQGMAIAFTITTTLSLASVLVLLLKMIGLSFGELFSRTKVPLLKNGILIAALAGICALVWALSASDWLRLAVPAVFLCLWLLIVNKSEIADLRQLIADKGERS